MSTKRLKKAPSNKNQPIYNSSFINYKSKPKLSNPTWCHEGYIGILDIYKEHQKALKKKKETKKYSLNKNQPIYNSCFVNHKSKSKLPNPT